MPNRCGAAIFLSDYPVGLAECNFPLSYCGNFGQASSAASDRAFVEAIVANVGTSWIAVRMFVATEAARIAYFEGTRRSIRVQQVHVPLKPAGMQRDCKEAVCANIPADALKVVFTSDPRTAGFTHRPVERRGGMEIATCEQVLDARDRRARWPTWSSLPTDVNARLR